jgi:hypothetical protein
MNSAPVPGAHSVYEIFLANLWVATGDALVFPAKFIPSEPRPKTHLWTNCVGLS